VKSNELLDFQIVHALEQRKERIKSLKRYLLASTLAAAIAALLCTAPANKTSIDLQVGGVTLSIPLTLAINLSAITSAFIYLHFALASRLTTAMEIRLLGLLSTRYGTKDLQKWLIFDSSFEGLKRIERESSKHANDAIAISLLCDMHLAAVPSNASQAKMEGDGNKPGV
jgi:hypothetical protein